MNKEDHLEIGGLKRERNEKVFARLNGLLEVGECDLYNEERNVLYIEEMNNIDKYNMEKYSTLDSSEKTIAILGDRWPQMAKQERDKVCANKCEIDKRDVLSAKMLEVPLFGVGTVLRLEGDA